MIVKPFAAVRPLDELAADASSLPAGSNERESLMGTLSALDINDSDLPDSSEPTAVYEAGRRMLDELIAKGTFIVDDSPCFYLYELEQNGHSQVGVVGCCSIDDYADCTIKKHENTIAQKAASVVRRLDTLNMQTGPIYLAYRDEEDVDAIVDEALKSDPLYSFVSKEGVTNTVWRISDPAAVEALQQAFTKVPTAYIADGHHRTAASVDVGFMRREKNGTFVGTTEADYFMSVLFPAKQLSIQSFSRLVRDLNGLTDVEFIERLTGKDGSYDLLCEQEDPFEPSKKGEMGVYVGGRWYGVAVHDSLITDDPVFSLDVALLQTYVLCPILGIDDPRTDGRLQFVRAADGADKLISRVDAIDEDGGQAVGFTMYPTAIEEFLRVADAGRLMPPKSTCFEPKLRSGLFIHDLS